MLITERIHVEKYLLLRNCDYVQYEITGKIFLTFLIITEQIRHSRNMYQFSLVVYLIYIVFIFQYFTTSCEENILAFSRGRGRLKYKRDAWDG